MERQSVFYGSGIIDETTTERSCKLAWERFRTIPVDMPYGFSARLVVFSTNLGDEIGVDIRNDYGGTRPPTWQVFAPAGMVGDETAVHRVEPSYRRVLARLERWAEEQARADAAGPVVEWHRGRARGSSEQH